jgi:hypothetical protein
VLSDDVPTGADAHALPPSSGQCRIVIGASRNGHAGVGSQAARHGGEALRMRELLQLFRVNAACRSRSGFRVGGCGNTASDAPVPLQPCMSAHKRRAPPCMRWRGPPLSRPVRPAGCPAAVRGVTVAPPPW